MNNHEMKIHIPEGKMALYITVIDFEIVEYGTFFELEEAINFDFDDLVDFAKCACQKKDCKNIDALFYIDDKQSKQGAIVQKFLSVFDVKDNIY